MFNNKREQQFALYNKARKHFIENPESLINIERFISEYLFETLTKNKDEIATDYNEASYLFPFWQNYPPDNRGRKPKGDQYPWIEVGEHVFANKLLKTFAFDFTVSDPGIPTGPDVRFVIKDSTDIANFTNELTDSCWVFIDIKSVGPRDDQQHTVMSHNQISGDGIWDNIESGIKNSLITAQGKHKSHPFFCAIPPLFILSDGTILPVITIAIKPVYKMLKLDKTNEDEGQPLSKITSISIPNGLLLFENPNYLKSYPNLFFPGKDDKGKKQEKMRARISFDILTKIAPWRISNITY